MAGIEFGALPKFCYAPDPYNNDEPALIYPGDRTYYGAARKLSQFANRMAKKMSIEALNQLAGVTPPQASAMQAGVIYGWDDPRANPAAYSPDGAYNEP